MISLVRTVASVEQITEELRGFIGDEAAIDLRDEDPATAIEVHFPPVRTQPLPARTVTSGDCSVDGFYDCEVDPRRPWIVYADDVAPARIRFTVLHELGHHLLATVAAALLDDLDRLGGSSAGAVRVEETVCHRLAAELLMPTEIIRPIIGAERIAPAHLKAVRQATGASWEAIAVRLSHLAEEPMAIILIREPGWVSFSAASPGLGQAWWPRGSGTDPSGPLFSAMSGSRTAVPETYRYGLGYARRLFCDAEPVSSSLAIAVLRERPSDGHFEILEEPEASWRERLDYCEWCYGDRDVGWCYQCRGQRCRDCFRCACSKPLNNPMCPECQLLKPRRAGAKMCRDCEADLA